LEQTSLKTHSPLEIPQFCVSADTPPMGWYSKSQVRQSRPGMQWHASEEKSSYSKVLPTPDTVGIQTEQSPSKREEIRNMRLFPAVVRAT